MYNLFIDLAITSVHLLFMFMCKDLFFCMLMPSVQGYSLHYTVHAQLFVACLYVSICAGAVLLYIGWVLFIQQ